MGCKIMVTQKDIDSNPMFYLYNALYSEDIRWKNMGNFEFSDLASYFVGRNLKMEAEKISEFIKESLKSGLICKKMKGYCISPR